MMRALIFLAGWFGLMAAALQINRMNLGHSICGPWDCGPPLEALLSIHFFWLALVLPPLLFVSRLFAAPWKFWGGMILGATLATLIGIGVWDVIVRPEPYQAGYWWQRYLFRVITLVDLPVPAALLTGLSLRIFGQRNKPI